MILGLVRTYLGLGGAHTPPWFPRWRAHRPSQLCMPTVAGQELSRVHCWSCHRDTHGDKCYIACGECGHGYRTRLHLLARLYYRDLQTRSDWLPPEARPWWPIRWTAPSKVYACPCCSHDF